MAVKSKLYVSCLNNECDKTEVLVFVTGAILFSIIGKCWIRPLLHTIVKQIILPDPF